MAVEARAVVHGALALVDGTLVGFVADMARNPTSVAVRGALALGSRTSGEFVGHTPSNSPFVRSGAPPSERQRTRSCERPDRRHSPFLGDAVDAAQRHKRTADDSPQRHVALAGNGIR